MKLLTQNFGGVILVGLLAAGGCALADPASLDPVQLLLQQVR